MTWVSWALFELRYSLRGLDAVICGGLKGAGLSCRERAGWVTTLDPKPVNSFGRIYFFALYHFFKGRGHLFKDFI
jgi:hypothetical protein